MPRVPVPSISQTRYSLRRTFPYLMSCHLHSYSVNYKLSPFAREDEALIESLAPCHRVTFQSDQHADPAPDCRLQLLRFLPGPLPLGTQAAPKARPAASPRSFPTWPRPPPRILLESLPSVQLVVPFTNCHGSFQQPRSTQIQGQRGGHTHGAPAS